MGKLWRRFYVKKNLMFGVAVFIQNHCFQKGDLFISHSLQDVYNCMVLISLNQKKNVTDSESCLFVSSLLQQASGLTCIRWQGMKTFPDVDKQLCEIRIPVTPYSNVKVVIQPILLAHTTDVIV